MNKMDSRLFSLRILCEKRPGVFVKLMQALDVLGLNVVHANITTFRGLVLNIFNAEVRDCTAPSFQKFIVLSLLKPIFTKYKKGCASFQEAKTKLEVLM